MMKNLISVAQKGIKTLIRISGKRQNNDIDVIGFVGFENIIDYYISKTVNVF